jgi:urease accessory protein
MSRFSPALIAATASTALAALLLQSPVLAHGGAGVTAAEGLLHPLLGLDHLLLLIAVGTAAAVSSAWLLLWALGGAVVGALLGTSGLQLPAVELLAALAVAAVAAWALLAQRPHRQALPGSIGRAGAALIAGAVLVHALLHGLEAPVGHAFGWWSMALLSSVAVCGGTTLLLRRLPVAAARWTAGTLVLLGLGLGAAA